MQAPWGVNIFFICSIGILVAQDTISSAASRHSNALKLHNQGVQFQEQGRFADSEFAFWEALHAWEMLPAATSEEIAATLNGLGNLLRVEGHYLEAEGFLRRA